jgi:choline dehydrogenase-like flavoprotein
MAAFEKADAVIVGAGAAGAVFAAVLTRAGKNVVLLEQGPDWQLSDLISSDIWARRLRGSGPAILYEGRHPVGRTADHGWGTGGAALHYSANFPRLLPSDFNMKSEHGRGLDWPISYADVAPITIAWPARSVFPATPRPRSAGARRARLTRCRR